MAGTARYARRLVYVHTIYIPTVRDALPLRGALTHGLLAIATMSCKA